jgi:hypothetical protein
MRGAAGGQPKQRVVGTHLRTEQSLEVERPDSRSTSSDGKWVKQQRQGGNGLSKESPAGRREKPLNGEDSVTWLRDETSP